MNQLTMYIPLTNYYSTMHLPKLQRMHMSIMALQQFLLDELDNSKENSGHTLHGEKYDNDLYVSMKAFWDIFTEEITHEYTCTSCKSTSQNQEPMNYLLLKFPDAHHFFSS